MGTPRISSTQALVISRNQRRPETKPSARPVPASREAR